MKNRKKTGKITRFFKEVKSELKKVVWPSKKQIIKNTLVVIAAVILVGIVIWLLDLLSTFIYLAKCGVLHYLFV